LSNKFQAAVKSQSQLKERFLT